MKKVRLHAVLTAVNVISL